MSLEPIEEHRCFGGTQHVFRHRSEYCGCPMEFGLFLPPQAGPRPALVYLSGLTCTWRNVTEKGQFQRACAEAGIVLIAPDTSPRGEGVPDDESYDLGQGAGFYVNATAEPWAPHYQMFDYVNCELPALIFERFDIDRERAGVFGHSMGGHGALISAFKTEGLYRSVSAFAPICHPSAVPWGQRALRAYLGDDEAAWRAHDATELVGASGWTSEILIDQGAADGFLEDQLRPESFRRACAAAGVPLTLRYHAGYDHSYYTMASFMEDHLVHHLRVWEG